MSGLVAPDRTAMPMLDRTRSTRLPRTTLPSAISPSSADAARITTSIGLPRRRRFGIASGELPIDGPNAVTILWPVARSNCGTSSRYAAVKAPDVTTLISSAVAAVATSRPARTRKPKRRGARIMPGDWRTLSRTGRRLDMQVNTCILSAMPGDADLVFKALADPSRRHLLDLLTPTTARRWARSAALDVAPGRDTAPRDARGSQPGDDVWQGREKLHYLNPVPLQEISDRWIGKFERSRLRMLRDLKKRVEGEERD